MSPRPTTRLTRTLLAVMLAVAAAGATALAAPSGAAVAAACTPGARPNTTTDSARWLSDTNAIYWAIPFLVQPGLRITMHGVYPDARYASVTVYTQSAAPFTTNGVFSELTDFKIAPDAGSINPWRQSGLPGGRFTIAVNSSAAVGMPNVLPIAPAGTRPGALGWLLYRIYLPAPGVSVPLPTVTFQNAGKSTTVSSCPATARISSDTPARTTLATGSRAANVSPPAGAVPAAVPQVMNKFSRTISGLTGGLANPDSGYLPGWILPPAGANVTVIRAKAPTTPAGAHPVPWPAGTQLRYWSVCAYLPIPLAPVVTNVLPDGTKDVGCRSDAATVRDAAGYYTFVLGTEAQRAAIEAVPGVTFIPFSSQYPRLPHLLMLRELMGGGFPQAIEHVPADHNPATAGAVMGQYYPSEATCPLATLVAGGPTACIRTGLTAPSATH